jgi:WD40 repeat protein
VSQTFKVNLASNRVEINALSENGKLIATAQFDTISIWTLQAGKVQQILEGFHQRSVRVVAFPKLINSLCRHRMRMSSDLDLEMIRMVKTGGRISGLTFFSDDTFLKSNLGHSELNTRITRRCRSLKRVTA